MKDNDRFIKAYHEFKDSVDLSQGGFLPEVDDLVCYMLMGIPRVPADEDPADDASLLAVDQRVAILKAVFVEANKDRPKDFLDKGMMRYDDAAKRAKEMLEESIKHHGSVGKGPA